MWIASRNRFAVGLCLALLLSAHAHAGVQQQTPSPTIAYSTSGPAILRITDRHTLAMAQPIPRADGVELTWIDILALPPEALEQGWRFTRVLCDTQTTNACLLERRRDNLRELARIDLARPSQPSWTAVPAGQVLDFDASSNSILSLNLVVQGDGTLTQSSLAGDRPPRQLWRAEASNSNANARFLRAVDGHRPILLMTGGANVHWQILTPAGSTDSRRASGTPSAALADTLYFASVTPDGRQSFYGSTPLPQQDGGWGRDMLIHRGDASKSVLASYARPGDLWPEAKSAAFLPNGDLLAITRGRDGLALSEICRPSAGAPVETQAVADVSSWLANAAQAWISGGAPASRTVIVWRTDLSGDLSLRALTLSSNSDSAEAIRICGETVIGSVDLPLPSSPITGNLTRTSHSITANDGATIEYDLISLSGRTGKIMVRPYGAYGLAPELYLARPFERQWVSEGNTLVVPLLRGDAGDQTWIDQGRGDHKQRAAQDLTAVAEDLMRKNPAAGRINLLGFSAGGFVSARAALNRPDLFDRVILISSVSDLSLSDAVDANSFDRAEFGTPTGGFQSWLGGGSAGPDAPKFIVLHGSGDPVVPAEASARFAAYVRGLGFEVKGQRYEGVGHDLANTTYVFHDIKELW
ncbi:MAG: hypothetical protein EON87_12720 [Brevundimonas sp.]|nr:MAG: hypothetical protein EON87_12720 [Brevundimonas sp.]